MAIKISVTPKEEALIFDKVFMLSISISQRKDIDSTKNPYYDLNIKYKIYATTSKGLRVFDTSVYSIDVPDYYSAALAQVSLGDATMVDAILSIEKVMAKLIQDKGLNGSTTIVP